jgi:hypothetical protein
MVVLKSCNEIVLLISEMPSEMRRFKFAVSWPCDDHIAAGTFVVKGSRQRRYDPISALSKDYSFQRLMKY